MIIGNDGTSVDGNPWHPMCPFFRIIATELNRPRTVDSDRYAHNYLPLVDSKRALNRGFGVSFDPSLVQRSELTLQRFQRSHSVCGLIWELRTNSRPVMSDYANAKTLSSHKMPHNQNSQYFQRQTSSRANGSTGLTQGQESPSTFRATGQCINGATVIPRIGYAALVHFNKSDAYRKLHHRFGCDGLEKRDLFDISGCLEAKCECGDFSLHTSETCICGHALSRHRSTPLESLKDDFRKYLAKSGKKNEWKEFENLVTGRPADRLWSRTI